MLNRYIKNELCAIIKDTIKKVILKKFDNTTIESIIKKTITESIDNAIVESTIRRINDDDRQQKIILSYYESLRNK